MISTPAAPRAQNVARNHTSPALPQGYCAIPRRLLTDLYDTPLAIGMYALVARLHLIARAPVPLSRADVLRYDPSLKPGAVKRAFDRLLASGWLAQAEQTRNQKHAYTPTWGRIKGTPLPWDLADACHGRPRHIQRLMLDRNLFDICMGKLVPHATLPATITRYITAPALSLTDIGSYALTLADIARPTPALRWLGLIQNDQARPLPSEHHLLAIISQQTLTLDDAQIAPATELTLSGTRRIGLAPQTPPNPHDDTAEPLFFVPPGLIGNLIGSLIGSQIGHTDSIERGLTAAESLKTSLDISPQPITWESMDSQETRNPPPTPSPLSETGGGKAKRTDQETAPRRRGRHKAAELVDIPDTEAVQLLRTINILPAQLIELSEIPTETIKAAIDDGKSRPGIRDLAGWVVTLLRTHRDYGWKIAPPQPLADSPEVLCSAFARYAVEQEAIHHIGTPEDQPWFPAPDPEPLHASGAPIRLWNQVQSALKTQLLRNEFNTWIRRATLTGVEQGVATIMVPTALAREVLAERYAPMLRDLLRMFTGESLELRVILNPSAQEQIAPASIDAPTESVPQSPIPSPRSPIPNPQPPAWIPAERWIALPIMLRAALASSELVDGEVQGRTPYLSMLLRTRYEREVRELITL
jgi:hypothetical protein